MRFEYVVQPSPDGLAQAFILGEEFLAGDDACLVLGDNIFYGHGLTELLSKSIKNAKDENKSNSIWPLCFDPQRDGCRANENGDVISIEEKPKSQNQAMLLLGLYFYPNDVVKKAGRCKTQVIVVN
ncbi:hypothetical protein MASR2M54_02770 [Aliarcobacter cryaerophilus]